MLFLFAVVAAAAQTTPTYRFPVACTLDVNCWIVRNVDQDRGDGAVDYRCEGLTADGHDGVDVAVASTAEIWRGVPVLAAASGTVVAVRDGMPDVAVGSPGAPDVTNRGCGNGIMVRQDDGRRSQYCHLRRGSLAVAEGDRIAAGQELGLVGMSGNANFPHLEYRLFDGDRVIDPMTGAAAFSAPCDAADRPIWSLPQSLSITPLVDVGLATAVPEPADVFEGAHRRAELPRGAPVLVAWAQLYGLQVDDRLHFVLLGENGPPLFDRSMVIERAFARGVYHVGDRRPGAGWPAGTYLLRVEVLRDGALTARSERRITLR